MACKKGGSTVRQTRPTRGAGAHGTRRRCASPRDEPLSLRTSSCFVYDESVAFNGTLEHMESASRGGA